MKENQVLNFYESVDAERKSTVIPQELEDIKAFLEIGNSQDFLDIGCYDGSKTIILAEMAQAKQLFGVDFIRERLKMAEALGIQTQWADLNDGSPLPYADSSFDFIYCGDVIEHIFSPDHLMLEIKRLLRPTGYALIRTPNLASWRNRVSLLLGYQPFMTEVSTQYRLGNPRMGKTKPSGHLHVFTQRAMREFVEIHGLRLDTLKGLNLHSQLPNPDLIFRLSKGIDFLVERFLPGMADEMLVKVRK